MSDADNDLALLFPDETITIGGEAIVVREFRYREGLEAAALARPIFAGLRAMVTGPDTKLAPESLDALIAAHPEVWLKLVSISCGKPVEWLAGLPDREAMKLQIAFWGANSSFFTRRLLFGAAFAAAVRERRSPSPSSSPNLSGPDSEPTSATSPSASLGASSNVISA